mmetsp:Transcript_31274/g.90934  ORF Transcript_31274/g.90934 Transcript_31274/m.90934 type:complete len:291 (-) Transcript_31274:61-933(-)
MMLAPVTGGCVLGPGLVLLLSLWGSSTGSGRCLQESASGSGAAHRALFFRARATAPPAVPLRAPSAQYAGCTRLRSAWRAVRSLDGSAAPTPAARFAWPRFWRCGRWQRTGVACPAAPLKPPEWPFLVAWTDFGDLWRSRCGCAQSLTFEREEAHALPAVSLPPSLAASRLSHHQRAAALQGRSSTTLPPLVALAAWPTLRTDGWPFGLASCASLGAEPPSSLSGQGQPLPLSFAALHRSVSPPSPPANHSPCSQGHSAAAPETVAVSEVSGSCALMNWQSPWSCTQSFG